MLAVCAPQGAGNSVPLPVATATATAALVVSLPIAAGQPVDGAGVSVSTMIALALVGPRAPFALLRATRGPGGGLAGLILQPTAGGIDLAHGRPATPSRPA